LKNNPLDIAAGLTYTDYQTLLGFYLARQGQFDDFLLDDPDDDSVGPGLIAGVPNPAAELQLIQDSVTGIWYSPVQRNVAGQFFEDITDLNGGIQVWANAVLQTGGGVNFTLLGPGLAITGSSFYGMYLQWAAMPTGPISATFNFYFRVRFETDQQDFEKFMGQLWTIGGQGGKNGSGTLKMRTSRIANL